MRWLKHCDLRFSNSADEQAFVASRRGSSLYNLCISCAIVFIATFSLTSTRFVTRDWQNDVEKWYVVFQAVLSLGSLGFGLTAWSMLLSKCTRLNYELLWVLAQAIGVTTVVLARRYNYSVIAQWFDERDADAVDTAAVNDEILYLALDFQAICLIVCAPMRQQYLIASLFGVMVPLIAVFAAFGSPLGWISVVKRLSLMVALRLMGSIGVWRREEYERHSWKQANELTATAALATGMTAMAERLCNYVLHLGSDLRVCNHDAIHESFFGQLLDGKLFLDIVSPQDRERFERMLASATTSGIPQLLPITLLCNSRQIEADVLVVDTGVKKRYLVGVRTDAPLEAFEACDDVCVGCADCDAFNAVQALEAHSARAGTTQPPTQWEPDDGSSTAPSVKPVSMKSSTIFEGACLDQIINFGMKENWLITNERLRIGSPTRVLGRGGYGEVIAAQLEGMCVAIKVPRMQRRESALRTLSNELRVLRRIRHINLVQFFGAVVDVEKQQMALVYEYIQGMMLTHYTRLRQGPVKEVDFYCMANDVCSALHYLHGHSPLIIHGDLKSDNVMIEQVFSRPRAKVIDFGLSCVLSRRTRRLGGTWAWSAPESFAPGYDKPAPSVDVFSFGWLANFIATGMSPHGGLKGDALHQTLSKFVNSGAMEPICWPATAPFASEGPELCMACLQTAPERRPHAAELQAWILRLGSRVRMDLGFDQCYTAQHAEKLSQVYDEVISGTMGTLPTPTTPCLVSCSVYARDKLSVCGFVQDAEGCGRSLVFFNLAEDLSEWFEQPESICLTIISIANDVYSGATHAPSSVDLGSVTLLATAYNAITGSSSSTSGSKVRLFVSYPAIDGRKREHYSVSVLLYGLDFR